MRRIPAGYMVAAAILALIVAALGGRHLYFRSKINAELDAIRKAGYPVTLKELSDYYPVPQGGRTRLTSLATRLLYDDKPRFESDSKTTVAACRNGKAPAARPTAAPGNASC